MCHVIDPAVDGMLDLTCNGLIDSANTTPVECAALNALTNFMSRIPAIFNCSDRFHVLNDRSSPIALPLSHAKLLPFHVQTPKLKLRPP